MGETVAHFDERPYTSVDKGENCPAWCLADTSGHGHVTTHVSEFIPGSTSIRKDGAVSSIEYKRDTKGMRYANF